MSNYIGVSYRKSRNQYEAYVNHEGKRHRLGMFHDEEKAARARDAYVKENGLKRRLNLRTKDDKDI